MSDRPLQELRFLISGDVADWVDCGLVVWPGEPIEVTAVGAINFAGKTTHKYGHPEGGYEPDYPLEHDEQPDAVAQFQPSWGTHWPALNTVPFSLAMAVRPLAAPPPPWGVQDALRPNRYRLFTPDEIAEASGGPGPWRAWFIFNDTDHLNDGAFDVILRRFAAGSNFMSDRFTLTQATQIGKESTPGAPAACPIRLKSLSIRPTIKANFKTHRSEGHKRIDLSIATKEWTECALEGVATYTELGYLLSSLVAKPVTQDLGAGVFQHTFASKPQDPDAMQTFTFEHGSAEGCERFSYGLISSLSFKSTRDTVDVAGAAFGRALQDSVNDGISMTPGRNEVQTVSLVADPTGGTFRLGFGGSETGEIAHDAAATDLEAALLALPSIGSGNCLVAGAAGGPWPVSFTGAMAGRKQELITLVENALIGGGAVSVRIDETTPGGYAELAKTPIMPGDLSVWLADDRADLDDGGHKLLRSFGLDFTLGERSQPFWTQDSSQTSFAGHVETQPKEVMDLLLAANDVAFSLRSAYRQGQTKYLRVQATSQQFFVGTSTTRHRLTLDAAVQVTGVKEFKDEQGVYALGFELSIVDDPSWGRSYEAVLVNGVSGY